MFAANLEYPLMTRNNNMLGVRIALLVATVSMLACEATSQEPRDAGGPDCSSVCSGKLDAGHSVPDAGPDGKATAADADPLIGAEACTAEVACGHSASCYSPSDPSPACGIPPNCPAEKLCTADDECKAQGAHFICALGTDCQCSGSLTCVAGCAADSDCLPGLTCNSQHRCVARQCGAGAACPANFDCQAGTCERRACTSSDQCGGGYCVNGACHATPGMCEVPRP